MLAIVAFIGLALTDTPTTPYVMPTNPPVFDRIEAAVVKYCPGAIEQRPKGLSDGTIENWSVYVHHVIRCGDAQKGIVRARLYGEAVDQIVASILYSHPDADAAKRWRDTAKTIGAKALPLAKADPDLVDHLNNWLDSLP